MTPTLLLLASLLSPSAHAASILYCRDQVFGPDAMEAALDASSHTVTIEPDVATNCGVLIASGIFDVVIVAQQGASVAVPALDSRIAANLPTIVQDVGDTLMDALDVPRSGSNLLAVSAIHSSLSGGLVSATLSLDSSVWPEFSKSLSGGAGGVGMAEFEDGNSAVVLVGTSVFLNGFFVDVAAVDSAADMAKLYTNQIAFALAGGGGDSDGDGMLDAEEFAEGTSLIDKDTDDDGLSDGAEWNVYFCDPLVQDTDGDGIGDATEVGRDYETVHTLPGYFLPDADPTTTTDPNDADTDDDGLPDDVEDANLDGARGDLETEPSAFDTDGDGVGDGTEIGLTTAESPDTDLAMFVTDADASTTTNPLEADTDAGGVVEGGEDFDVNGRVDVGECDPNDVGDDANCADTDGDGLSDGREAELGTDPLIADTDAGGVRDADEVRNGTDPLDGADDRGIPPDTDEGDDSGAAAGVRYVYAGRGCDSAGGTPVGAAVSAVLLLLATRRRR